METPSVTVGIVTYNRLEYLPVAIQSALNQGDAVKEILVVDDGSTDGTPEYVNRLANPKVRCVVHEKNGGRPVARNTAVKNMKGDFLMWLDDDDAFADKAVNSQLACLSKNPNADIIYCDHVRCDEHLSPQQVTPSKAAAPGQMLMQLVYENIIPNGGSFIRKTVFDRVGPYFESEDRTYRYEDYELFARAAVAGCSFVHNPAPLYHFRFHENNLANPEINRDQSYNHCLIVQSILAKANLEDVYPILPWGDKPQESGATAMTLLSKVFFDHGDDQSALECVDYAEQFMSTQRARIMKAYILRSMGRATEAADAFANVVKELDPDLAYMDVEVGALRGSAASAEQARKAREGV
jgi:glycosyltransferase involved in cell wall biosynthesis